MPRTPLILLLITLLCGACTDSSDQHMERAREYLASADYPSASAELKSALRADRQLAEARWLLGKLYLELGEVRAAEKELRRAGELGWPANDVRPALAKSELAQGKFAQVLRLDTHGLQPEAAARLLAIQALAELASGRNGEARRKLATAREKFPESQDVQLSQARLLAHEWNTRAAGSLVDEVLDTTPENAEAWRLKGQLLLQQEKLPAARDAFERAINLATVAFSDRITHALINYQLGEFDAVRDQLQILLQLSPRHPSVHYILGLLQFKDRQYRLAVKSFSVAYPVATQYPTLLYYASIARLIEKDAALAAVLAEEFVQLAPYDIRGRKLLAMIRLQQKKALWAYTIIQPVLDYNPEDTEALKISANALLLEGKAALALDLYARAARLLPQARISELALGLMNPGGGEVDGRYLDPIRVDQPDFPLDSIMEILEHLRAQDFEQAVKAAEVYTWENPLQEGSFQMQAKILLAAGQAQAAEQVLTKLLERDPGNPGASRLLSEIALRAGDADRAREYCKDSLVHYSSNQSVLLQLASVDVEQGLLEQAEIRLEQTMAVHAAALLPRLRLAAFYLGQGKPAKVAAVFDSLDGLQQRSPRVLELASNAATAEGSETATRAAFEKTLAADANHIPSLAALALMAEAAGDSARFERYLSPLTKLAPNEPLVIHLRARSARLNQEPALAAALYERAYETSPSTASLLSLVDLHSEAGKLKEAEYEMRRWLEIDPYDIAVRTALAVNLESSGRLDEAKIEYNAILESEPDNTVALNNMAWLLKDEDLALATKYTRRATAIAENSPALLDTLAVIEHINGDNVKARSAIEQALKLAPGHPTILFHEAMIAAGAGEKARAITSLEKLLAQDAADFLEKQQAVELLEALRAQEGVVVPEQK